jgi:uncharacterized protein YsxB (DUF464 family)
MIGHAGYKPGEDIVCAALSILITTLAQNVNDLDSWNCIEKIIRLVPGDSEVTLRKKTERPVDRITYEINERMYRSLITGFELLEQKFPQNVCLEWVGDKKKEVV